MSAVIVLIIRILIAICLYTFLGIAIYTLWKELKLASQRTDIQVIPEIFLTIMGDFEEIRPFAQQEITVGREAICDFIIPDDTISSLHARFSYHHAQWWVEDLQSTNGTYLNDERIYTPTVIVTGDELALGKVILQIEIKGVK